MLSARTALGTNGILARHDPLLALLEPNELRLYRSESEFVRFAQGQGYASGLPRRTPVNVLELDGERYLVAPRGDTQWARNLRVSGEGRLRLGRKLEPFTAIEVTDEAEKAAILRAYLRRWKAEVSAFFDGVRPDASEEELRRIAAKHPVFRLRSGAQ